MNKKIYSKLNEEARRAKKAGSEIGRVVMVSVVFIDQISQSTQLDNSTRPTIPFNQSIKKLPLLPSPSDHQNE
jgi:hypothetical protein